jgi:CBS domain-containing protein
MGVGEICSREVVFARRSESVAQAARLMRQHHVGSVVVADERNGRFYPAGIITDRDIALGVVALGQDPEKRSIEAAMPAELVCVRETDGLGRAVALMRAQGVRRLPVIDAAGALVGILSADDALEILSEELYCLAGMVARGERLERDQRKAA